jgi:DNA primase catalytic subunit
METKTERRMLLSKIIDNLPTMDVRPFVQVVDKIVASLGDSAKGEFDGYVLGEMTNKILQLRRDVKELLPPERIQLMSRDADEWAEKQKQRLREQRKVTKQRLKAAQDTTDYDDEIRLRGEMERMT